MKFATYSYTEQSTAQLSSVNKNDYRWHLRPQVNQLPLLHTFGTRWQGGSCKCCRRTWLTFHQHPYPIVTIQIY